MATRTDAPPCPVGDCTNAREWTGQRFAAICRTHRARKRRFGNLLAEVPVGSMQGPAYDETCTYKNAHARVTSARGKASSHLCTDCGDPAAEWSYDHKDPHEFSGPVVSRKGAQVLHLIWSGDPNHYSPRCTPCHRAFDREV